MENWVKKQRELLELEATSEASQLIQKISSLPSKVCEQEGLSITNLEVINVRTELFGRCSIELQKIAKLSLPSGLKVGDEVTILPSRADSDSEDDDDNESEIFGLVRACSNLSIEIIMEEYNGNLAHSPLRINLRPSLTTHRRMMDALNQLQISAHPLFYHVYFPTERFCGPLLYLNGEKVTKWYNSGLNSSQKEAIECSLNSSLVSIVHGPPGTGKTSTLTELILQSVERNRKLLVCGPSNIAVDTILQRVVSAIEVQSKLSGKNGGAASKYLNRIVRIGHPARIHSSILQYTLDHHIAHDEGTQIVRDIHEEIQVIRNKLQRKTKNSAAKSSGSESKKELRTELRQIRKEANERERQVVKQILTNAVVVFSTCVGAASSLLKNIEFDVAIIDEAAQGIEAACWIPILKCKTCVLAGDHCQLPPTIKNEQAAKEGLQITLFEKIIKDSRFASFSKLLNIQYRMNDIINQWASIQMYNGEVISDESVANHTLYDLIEQHAGDEDTSIPVAMMIDTSDECMYEENASENVSTTTHTSHRNVHEAYITLQHCLYLLTKLGICGQDIGVITPYNGQLEILKQLFQSYATNHNVDELLKIEIKTIDGFQGGEKECIILSLVRSNEHRNVGFLSEKRRLNVAITRAKRHVAIIGDATTCSSDTFIGSLINHIENFGEIIPYSLYNEFYYPPIQDNLEKSIVRAAAASSSSAKAKKSTTSKATTNSSFTKSNKDKSITTINTNNIRNKTNVNSGATSVKNNAANESTTNEDTEARKTEFEDILAKYKEGKITGGTLLVCEKSNSQKNNNILSYSHLLLAPAVGSIPEKSSNESSLRFPPQLNSFERMLIHSISSELHLSHQSISVGEERYIEVSKSKSIHDNIDIKLTTSGGSKDMQRNENEPAAEVTNVSSDDENPQTTIEYAIEDNKSGMLSSDRSVQSSKKIIKPNNSQKKTNKQSQNKVDLDLDEDALLQLAIQQNRELANAHKYRIGSTPFKNPEKEASKQKLKVKLQEAVETRRSLHAVAESQSDKSNNEGNNNRKKVLKKPVPNFGGGKVGTK